MCILKTVSGYLLSRTGCIKPNTCLDLMNETRVHVCLQDSWHVRLSVKTSQCDADVSQCELRSSQSELKFPVLSYLSKPFFLLCIMSTFF